MSGATLTLSYRFTDYWRLGSVMLVVFFVVAVGFVPLVWGF